jgi:site-specific recombinase XerD
LIKRQARVTTPKSLTDKEVRLILQLVAASKNTVKYRNEAIIQLMLYAGLRVGEVVSLNCADVTLKDRSGHILIRKGKGNKERIVYLGSSVLKTIKKFFKQSPIF